MRFVQNAIIIYISNFARESSIITGVTRIMLGFIHSFNLSVMYTEFIFIINHHNSRPSIYITVLRDTKVY